MSGFIEFEAPCFAATLTVNRDTNGRWAVHLFTFAGKQQTYRSIALILGDGKRQPEVHDDGVNATPRLWLGTAAIELPATLVPKIRAFLTKHILGGAA